MRVWKFDESQADFRPVTAGEIEADPDALYIIQRGDDVLVRDAGEERTMPERLVVAGVPFDREQFEGPHLARTLDGIELPLPIPSRCYDEAHARISAELYGPTARPEKPDWLRRLLRCRP
ncbi:hypothetical protein FG147_06515 [Thauera sp. UPWRP]|nr:hypothetical protein FG147_06515 [Thauera sp. UPWRP]